MRAQLPELLGPLKKTQYFEGSPPTHLISEVKIGTVGMILVRKPFSDVDLWPQNLTKIICPSFPKTRLCYCQGNLPTHMPMANHKKGSNCMHDYNVYAGY